MPYTYTWTPQNVRANSSSRVSVHTWDGKSVPGTTVTISAGRVIVTVPEKNRYKLTVSTGSVQEHLTATIPHSTPNPPLAERVETIEQALFSGEEGTVANIVPDPDNDGYFLIL